jgi:hypothetical protein
MWSTSEARIHSYNCYSKTDTDRNEWGCATAINNLGVVYTIYYSSLVTKGCEVMLMCIKTPYQTPRIIPSVSALIRVYHHFVCVYLSIHALTSSCWHTSSSIRFLFYHGNESISCFAPRPQALRVDKLTLDSISVAISLGNPNDVVLSNPMLMPTSHVILRTRICTVASDVVLKFECQHRPLLLSLGENQKQADGTTLPAVWEFPTCCVNQAPGCVTSWLDPTRLLMHPELTVAKNMIALSFW